MDRHQIFLVATPGLEEPLRDEALSLGFHNPRVVHGGVTFEGKWEHAWRANLWSRGAVRVLVRVGAFKAHHLNQLGPETRATDWASLIAPGTPFRVEAVCRKSRLYHEGAVAERVTAAIAEASQATPSAEAPLRILARVERDHVTLSIDTSGAPLHRREHKAEVGKAPLRETMAAMFLRQLGFDGSQPVLDPMCGSGTIPIEAAEIAAGLAPGRSRSFAFEELSTFDPDAWQVLKATEIRQPPAQFFGYDRDGGAIRAATANAERAGVDGFTSFARQPLTEAAPPQGTPGIVLTNPPYGDRIGTRRDLFALYSSFGRVMQERFAGWTVGLVTSDEKLAQSTRLPLTPGPFVAHGGLKVRLWQGRIDA
ncbi:THUMP domain-containing class I SAM-dependent RNA methyltransferase [Pseudaestuariivita atlantica]|uniref:RNA methyltransferase n=1 Tax=Pseudaestuariivita atlantica TaxID=1317121 RepID=A0A0L1JR84_9RHOB|nr:THUMP domain-containing protein [Pseudaestuariivita atlantica]KNG94255.1 RNA methyltransferase [Pseudaestuariivita atlantica]